jgi:hypothetical protein
MKRHSETLLDSFKEIGLQANSKTRYIFINHYNTPEKTIKKVPIKCLKNVAML